MQNRRCYTVISTVAGEYERDVLPMPSGYAKVSLTLEPLAGPTPPASMVTLHSDARFLILQGPVVKTSAPISLDEQMTRALLRNALTGVSRGANEALNEHLDRSVIQVKVQVHELLFHLGFSSVMAFKIAGYHAVCCALDSAAQQGQLVTCLED